MPKKRSGRDRIDYKGDAPFIDAVKEAARLARKSLSEYIRVALEDRMRKDGVEIPPPEKKDATDA